MEGQVSCLLGVGVAAVEELSSWEAMAWCSLELEKVQVAEGQEVTSLFSLLLLCLGSFRIPTLRPCRHSAVSCWAAKLRARQALPASVKFLRVTCVRTSLRPLPQSRKSRVVVILEAFEGFHQ